MKIVQDFLPHPKRLFWWKFLHKTHVSWKLDTSCAPCHMQTREFYTIHLHWIKKKMVRVRDQSSGLRLLPWWQEKVGSLSIQPTNNNPTTSTMDFLAKVTEYKESNSSTHKQQFYHLHHGFFGQSNSSNKLCVSKSNCSPIVSQNKMFLCAFYKSCTFFS